MLTPSSCVVKLWPIFNTRIVHPLEMKLAKQINNSNTWSTDWFDDGTNFVKYASLFKDTMSLDEFVLNNSREMGKCGEIPLPQCFSLMTYSYTNFWTNVAIMSELSLTTSKIALVCICVIIPRSIIYGWNVVVLQSGIS